MTLATVSPTSTATLLRIIAGRDTAALIELRYARDGGGMAQEWFPTTQEGMSHAERRALGLGRHRDVYVGVAPRTRRVGGRDAIRHAWCLWVDCDDAEAVARLIEFRPRPTLAVRSGTEGNVHAYWALEAPIPARYVEQANRRLALAVGADQRATDAARILRCPGTRNFKHEPPTHVETVHFDGRRHSLADLVSALPAPTPRGALPRPAAPRPMPDTDDLRAVPADVYYSRLSGLDGDIGRHVKCPFWDHRSPRQMMLYDDGSWFCWPCDEGGTIYDFAAKLWNMSTKGAEFQKLKTRIRDELS